MSQIPLMVMGEEELKELAQKLATYVTQYEEMKEEAKQSAAGYREALSDQLELIIDTAKVLKEQGALKHMPRIDVTTTEGDDDWDFGATNDESPDAVKMSTTDDAEDNF